MAEMILCLVLLITRPFTMLALPTTTTTTTSKSSITHRVIVIGKIIIDEYGSPEDDSKPTISIGGGGPQAAWGAAASLAARDLLESDHLDDDESGADERQNPAPPSQPVTFLGPVGKDWSPEDALELGKSIGPALDRSPIFIPSEDHITPRIRLWHDDDQAIQWYAVNDSFGPKGADGLWRNRPSADDIAVAIDDTIESSSGKKDAVVVLHSIMEAGASAASDGMDCQFLRNPHLVRRIDYIGIEPIAFTNAKTGQVSVEDATSCKNFIESFSSSLQALCPDNHLAVTLEDIGFLDPLPEGLCVAIREGPKGSTIIFQDKGESNRQLRRQVPAATLLTPNKEPVNPTGAGNAYSAAYTALLGTGSLPLEAACLATAVGAVVCEYDQLPPWEWSVIERIRRGAEEVRQRIMRDGGIE